MRVYLVRYARVEHQSMPRAPNFRAQIGKTHKYTYLTHIARRNTIKAHIYLHSILVVGRNRSSTPSADENANFLSKHLSCELHSMKTRDKRMNGTEMELVFKITCETFSYAYMK